MNTSSSATQPAPGPATLARLLSVLIGLVLLAASCSSGVDTLDADVARELDQAGSSIADLTSGSSEVVSRESLESAIAAAREAGTNLRIVIASPDGEFISAKSVVDRYGGTAISYQASQTSFEGASRDMSVEQLDRAVGAAKLELDIGDSAAAFVDVLETEGIEERGRSVGRTALLLAVIPASLFLISGAVSYLRARKRRNKRRDDFNERRDILREWASHLTPEVEALAPAAARADAEARRILDDAATFSAAIPGKLDQATSIGELDAAEVRIGRTVIKLRDLRQSFDL